MAKINNKVKKVKISFAPGKAYTSLGLTKILPILKKTDTLFLNRGELENLIKSKALEKAKILLTRGCKIVVITSPRKCWVLTKKERLMIPALKVKVKDTTGAGDIFAAGFLYGILKEKDLLKCGQLAHTLAFFCAEKAGARKGLPSIRKLTKRYKKYSAAR